MDFNPRDFRISAEGGRIQMVHTICEEMVSGGSLSTHLDQLVKTAARHECPEE